MTTSIATGVCPVCKGSTRRPVPADSRKYLRYNARWGHWGISGYLPAGPGPFVDGAGYDGGTFACNNCGGQTMGGRATGTVPLRDDGTPCHHHYKGTQRGRCYWVYQCQHCPYSYDIDSGD